MPRARSQVALTPGGGLSLDPVSPVPLHRQLRDAIANSIADQGIAPGAMLPGEHAICREFSVSRTVVRQALAHLEADGIIERVKGKGTFVARRRTPEQLAHTLLGLYEEAEARGSTVRSEVRRLEWIEASPTIARELQVDPGTRVLLLERLRIVDDEPWSLSTTWLPARLGPVVEGADLTASSLYQLLRAHGTWATSGVRSVDAMVANPQQAELLGLRAGHALLVLHSVSFDQEDRPMEVFTAYHRGDRSRFEFHLRAGSATGSEPVQHTADSLSVELSSMQPFPKSSAGRTMRPGGSRPLLAGSLDGKPEEPAMTT